MTNHDRIVKLEKSGDSWMYPYQCTPMANPYISPIQWVFMGYNPQEFVENTINAMGTMWQGYTQLSLEIKLPLDSQADWPSGWTPKTSNSLDIMSYMKVM